MTGASTQPLAAPAVNKDPRTTPSPITTATPAVNKDPRTVSPLPTDTAPVNGDPRTTTLNTTANGFQVPATPAPPITPPTATPNTTAAPQVDPISGLPIRPAGTQPTTVNSAVPIAPVQYDKPAPAQQTYTPPVSETQVNTQPVAPAQQTYAPPVDQTTVQPETPAPPATQAYTPPATETQVNPQPVTPPAPANPITATPETPVSAPVKTAPSLDDNMAMYEKIAADWANGIVDDKVFRTTANIAIMQMGLKNQAETDALQMRINSDPALRNQGAGSAMLSMMAANHGFSADQMFGQLAQSAQQKILDMQKYGLQEGVAINQMRRQNDYTKLQMLQDAGDFSGAAQLAAKIADFPGANISPSSFTASRARLTQDANTLMAAGNYVGAAEKFSQMTGQTIDATQLQGRDPAEWKIAQALEDKGDFTGAAAAYSKLGLNITSDDLRAQNPFQQQTWTNTLDAIKAEASVNPAKATAELDALMKNPSAAKYLGFTPDTSAADLIQSIVTGKYQADQQMRAGLQSEINLKAKSNVGFSQALVDYKALGPQAWQGMTQDGQKMANTDLTAFNTARSELGMSAVHKDAQGNIVDANGTALTDEDFAQTAAAADYTSRIDKMNTQPWQAAYDNLMAPNSPMHDKILSIPGGEASVKESLQMLFLGGGYKVDPVTQTMVPDYSGGMPWESGSPTSYLFHNWPLAQFNPDGTVNGKYDAGGETYGDKLGDTTIQKMPDDEQLDHGYATYKYNQGTLTAAQWYFATAGGTKPEDKTKVPAELMAADATKVGTTPGNQTSNISIPTGTETVTPGSTGDKYQQFGTLVSKTAGLSATDSAALTKNATDMANAYQGKAPGVMIPLEIGVGGDFDHAFSRLQNLGVKNLDNIVQGSAGRSGILGYDSTKASYTGTPEFANYSIYVKMLDSGMSVIEARNALSTLLGPDRAQAALNLEPENQASSDVSAAINKVR